MGALEIESKQKLDSEPNSARLRLNSIYFPIPYNASKVLD